MGAGIKGQQIGNSKDSFAQAIFPGTVQKVALAAGASPSNAFGSGTRMVRVCANQDFHIAFGASPTATNSTAVFVPKNVAEYFLVNEGEKASVMRDSADGFVYIVEAAVIG